MQQARNSLAQFHPHSTLANTNSSTFTIKFVTYIVECLSATRTQQIILQAMEHKLSAITLMGTRSTYSQDKAVGEYMSFHLPSGSKGTEIFTGVTILIHQSFLHTARVNKIIIYESRALAIRIKTNRHDFTIIGAFAPGDHLERSFRQQVWAKLNQHIRQLPKRTTPIMGIDANGHIGRDGGAHWRKSTWAMDLKTWAWIGWYMTQT